MPNFFNYIEQIGDGNIDQSINLDEVVAIAWVDNDNARIVHAGDGSVAFENSDCVSKKDIDRLKAAIAAKNWLQLKSMTVNIDHIGRVIWDGINDGVPCTHINVRGDYALTYSLTNNKDRLALRKRLVGDDWQPN